MSLIPHPSLPPELAPLVVKDALQPIGGIPCPGFAHRDHRWTLPLVRWGQLAGNLPTPTRLVLFDLHHDALPPRHTAWMRNDRAYDISIPALIELCDAQLSTLDDDWITAGMELGLFSDAVVFGVDDTFDANRYCRFDDSRGMAHHFHFPGLPGQALDHQGALADLAAAEEYADLWAALEWQPGSFAPRRTPFALDVDLDCFAVEWRDYVFPWPTEVWQAEFDRASEHWSTAGYSGKRWFQELAAAAGLFTVSFEPNHCGGDANAQENWERLNEHLFDRRLTLG